MSGSTYAVITGGGTGGHVNPGLAVADALVALGHPASAIHYVGTPKGAERDLVPRAGYPLTLVRSRGLDRGNPIKAIPTFLVMAVGFVQGLVLLGRLRPRVVVAVGGYASLPVGLAAVLWRIPLVLAEQNVTPGLANRVLTRWAKAAAVAFPGTPLARAEVVGNPIRAAVSALDPDRDRAAAKAALGVDPDRSLVLVFGGSGGSLAINRATVAALDAWRGRADLRVHHVIGKRDWSTFQAPPADLGALEYHPVEYEYEMVAVLAAADVAVCRSGSSTCFELAAAALPSVLIPSPNVTDDQQTGNARKLVDAGAAVLLPEREMTGDRIVAEVDALLQAPDRRAAMAAAAHAWARPHAAADIAALAATHARG